MDKRSSIVTPVHAVYGPDGSVLTVNDPQQKVEEPEIQQAANEPFQEPKQLTAETEPVVGEVYLIDDWIFQGHRLRVVGVFDKNGDLQGGMFIADHDGSPHSFVKDDQNATVLFNRLVELKGLPTHVDNVKE